MIVGFTGTQLGMTRRQKKAFRNKLKELGATLLHHGDCIGADSDAHSIAMKLGIAIMVHPPECGSKRAFREGFVKAYEPRPYLERNHEIVNSVDFMIACPKSTTEELRSGTWATIRYARKIGKPGVILAP